jgi:hypothetical protein
MLASIRHGVAVLISLALTVSGDPATGAGNQVRITKLSDVAFGTIANLGVDAVQSQSVCVYTDQSYRITGIGSGPGGSFQLNSGAQVLPYEVQWSSSAGQSSGTQLNPNVPRTGLNSVASNQTCSSGPATSASLIVILRAAALSSATAGIYGGTLTLIAGAE